MFEILEQHTKCDPERFRLSNEVINVAAIEARNTFTL